MNILYLLRKNPDDTVNQLIEEQKKTNHVSVININDNNNYDEIVDAIFSNDKIISW
jgi:hypothetical protein